MFPINTLFGGAAYNRPITLTAANTLISDGQNLWAGTYTIIPASTTNPVVSLYPNTYLLTVPGVVKPARFTVPASTNTLDVTTLLTSGPLFYFGTNGFASLLAGANVLLVTNTDGSITISSSGGPGGSATNLFFISGTNTFYDTLNGSNRFSVPATAFDAPGAAQTALASAEAFAATNWAGNASNAQFAVCASVVTGPQSNTLALAVQPGDSPVLNAAHFTNLNASQITGGTIPLAQLPAAIVTNGQPAVRFGSGFFTVNPDGSFNAGPNFFVTAAGMVTGNGANLTNTPSSITVAGLNVTVTASTNAATGQITYTVAFSGAGSATNAVALLNGGATNLTVYGFLAASNFAGNGFNVTNVQAGNVIGLGNVAGFSSNQIIAMAGAAIAGSNYLNSLPGSVVTDAASTNASAPSIADGTLFVPTASSGSATNAINPNGGTGTNINLTKITTVDQHPVLYATPTLGVFYGDSITAGAYVANGYVADLTNLGFQHLTAVNNAISGAHLSDVSNYFYGSYDNGVLCYTNWLGKAGYNSWVSFWIGINDCLFDGYPMDTNTWITSYTNLWWIAHTNGANPVVVFTIADSAQLSAGGESNRLQLNSLIYQAATNDAAWVVLLNNDLILPATNTTFYLYNASANYGLHPNDYGHSQVAQALASQLMLQTNLARGAYFNGPVWSATGFGGNGSNLFNLPANKITGTLSPTNVPVNTVVAGGSGITVASNSLNGVQTYTVSAGAIAATPSFMSKRCWFYAPTTSGSTVAGFGVAASASGSSALISATTTDPYYMMYYTGASSNSASLVYDNNNEVLMSKPFNVIWRAGLTNISNVRAWVTTADASTVDTGDLVRRCIGFRYVSTNASPDWMLVTVNQGITAWTQTDTGIAADTNMHTFEISYDGSANAYGYIDGVCVATNSANFPTMQLGAFLTITTLDAIAKGIRFAQFYGEQGF